MVQLIIQRMCSAVWDAIRYIYQNNKGRSAARNLGIQTARENILLFSIPTIYFSLKKNAVQMKALDENPEYGMVYSYACAIDEKESFGYVLARQFLWLDISRESLYKELPYNNPFRYGSLRCA